VVIVTPMTTRHTSVAVRALLATAMLLAATFVVASRAEATPIDGPSPNALPGPETALIFEALGEGQSVTGFFPPTGSSFDPATDPYPTTNPEGWTPQTEGYAGTLIAYPPGGDDPVRLYCIDLFTETRVGYGYEQGTWDEGNVPNVGLVARALSLYYPNTDQPAAPSPEARAAATQATIWFFSDRYVLSTADPLYSTVALMVAEVQGLGPVPEPSPPALSIIPAAERAPVGEPIGPFTVSTDDPTGATLTLVDAPAGAGLATAEGPLDPDTRVPDGTEVFITGVTEPTTGITIVARATTEVASGNVYLYDGLVPGVNDAQKLILAETATTESTASATGEAFAAGALQVSKQIVGAQGAQGEVVIEVVCGDVDLEPFVIPAGAEDGEQVKLYEGIEAGTSCTITETADGSSEQLTVEVTGSGQTLEIVGAEQTDADPVVNTYTPVSPTTSSTSTTSTSTTSTTQMGPSGPTDGGDVGGDTYGPASAGRGRLDRLPYTGADTLRLAAVAFAVAAGGLALVLVARRRRTS